MVSQPNTNTKTQTETELHSLSLPGVLQSPVLGRRMNYKISSDMKQNPIVGFGFRPNDFELIYIFLRAMLEGVLTDCEEIPTINIYDFEPSDLADFSRKRSEDDTLYFFCAPQYIGKNAKNRRRTTRAGFWKPTGKPRVVKHKKTGKKIGEKRTIVFHFGRGKGTPTEWVMHEYTCTEKRSSGGSASKSNQGDFVLCKIMKKFDQKCSKNESSLNTLTVLTDHNGAAHQMTSSISDKSESSFNIVAFSLTQNIGGLPLPPEVVDKNESNFNTLIYNIKQTEVNDLVASLERELGLTTSISSNSLDKSESSFNIFTVNEIDQNYSLISFNKSESSFNINTSFDFHNGNGNQIMANAAIYGNEADYPVASANLAEETFDSGNQNQNLMIIDSVLPNGKARESGAGFNTSTSSSFASKETNSAICRNKDSCSMPSDLGNQMPDRSPNVLYDADYFHPSEFESSMPSDLGNQMPDRSPNVLYDDDYFHPSEFEDQSAPTTQAICSKENLPDHQLRDRQELKALLNYKFHEEFRQVGGSVQLILSYTNCERPETSMNRDFNQDQPMQSDVPMIDSEPDLDAFFQL